MSKYRKHFSGPLAFLSNMEPCRITVFGDTYGCAETAYQAMKIENPTLRHRTYGQPMPDGALMNGYYAKSLGRKCSLRADWNDVRLPIMANIVRNKFLQNPNLRTKLLQVNPDDLVERNNWGDTFWGIDKLNGGHNWLGKILRQVQYECRLMYMAQQMGNTSAILYAYLHMIHNDMEALAFAELFEIGSNNNMYANPIARQALQCYRQNGPVAMTPLERELYTK